MKKGIACVLALLCLIGLVSCGKSSKISEISRYRVDGKYYVPTALLDKLQVSFDVDGHMMTCVDADGNSVTCHYNDSYTLLQQITNQKDGTTTYLTVRRTDDADGVTSMRSEIRLHNDTIIRYTITYGENKSIKQIGVRLIQNSEDVAKDTIVFTDVGNGLSKMQSEVFGNAYWGDLFGVLTGNEITADWIRKKDTLTVSLTVDGAVTQYTLTEVSEAEATMFREYYDFTQLYSYIMK